SLLSSNKKARANALIKQYQKLIELEGVHLEFTRDALISIANKAMDKNLGARGLRSIVEDLMLDLMFHLPALTKPSKIRVTKRMVMKSEINIEHLKKSAGAL
ncbi:MAG: hypothetical protein KAX11_10195, partial [Candidatus Aminicenantes bacterium]|nr:hypothetical protein [Candidatus Aminicenantes bacterium]